MDKIEGLGVDPPSSHPVVAQPRLPSFHAERARLVQIEAKSCVDMAVYADLGAGMRGSGSPTLWAADTVATRCPKEIRQEGLCVKYC